jgi:hypothetical protein
MPIRTGWLTILAITETSLEYNPTQVPHPEHLYLQRGEMDTPFRGRLSTFISFICGGPRGNLRRRSKILRVPRRKEISRSSFPGAVEIALFFRRIFLPNGIRGVLTSYRACCSLLVMLEVCK